MSGKILKTKKRYERGSATLFIVVSMLFFVTMLCLSYAKSSNKINSQRKMILKIEEQYSVDEADMQQAYIDAGGE